MAGTANIMRSATSAMIASFIHGVLFERLRSGWAGGMVVTVISTLSSGILNLLDLYIFNSFIYLAVPLAGHALSITWARWWRCDRTPKFGQPAMSP